MSEDILDDSVALTLVSAVVVWLGRAGFEQLRTLFATFETFWKRLVRSLVDF